MAETIRAPFMCGGEKIVREISGRSCWLIVGAEKVRFFMHGLTLSHYASGCRVACIWPEDGPVLDQDAAAGLVQRVVDHVGVEVALAQMSSAEILNDERGACDE